MTADVPGLGPMVERLSHELGALTRLCDELEAVCADLEGSSRGSLAGGGGGASGGYRCADVESRAGAVLARARSLAVTAPGAPLPSSSWMLSTAGHTVTALAAPHAVVAAAERFALQEALPLGVVGAAITQPALQRLSTVATAGAHDVGVLAPLLERAGPIGALAGRLPVAGVALQAASWTLDARQGKDLGPIVVSDIASTVASGVAGAVAVDATVAALLAAGLAAPAAPLIVAVGVGGLVAYGIGRATAAALAETGLAQGVATAVGSGVSAVARGGQVLQQTARRAVRGAGAAAREAADTAAGAVRAAWHSVFG